MQQIFVFIENLKLRRLQYQTLCYIQLKNQFIKNCFEI